MKLQPLISSTVLTNGTSATDSADVVTSVSENRTDGHEQDSNTVQDDNDFKLNVPILYRSPTFYVLRVKLHPGSEDVPIECELNDEFYAIGSILIPECPQNHTVCPFYLLYDLTYFGVETVQLKVTV